MRIKSVEELQSSKRKLNKLNQLIESAPKSFGRKETALYNQALKFREGLEIEIKDYEGGNDENV